MVKTITNAQNARTYAGVALATYASMSFSGSGSGSDSDSVCGGGSSDGSRSRSRSGSRSGSGYRRSGDGRSGAGIGLVLSRKLTVLHGPVTNLRREPATPRARVVDDRTPQHASSLTVVRLKVSTRRVVDRPKPALATLAAVRELLGWLSSSQRCREGFLDVGNKKDEGKFVYTCFTLILLKDPPGGGAFSSHRREGHEAFQ